MYFVIDTHFAALVKCKKIFMFKTPDSDFYVGDRKTLFF